MVVRSISTSSAGFRGPRRTCRDGCGRFGGWLRGGAAPLTAGVDAAMVPTIDEVIRRGKRHLAAEPLRDQRVGIGNPQQDQRAPEALDVRRFPGLAGHQILGDHARFRPLARGQIGVRELGLRLVHVRLETAVHADLDELEQRWNLTRHARDELLQAGRRLARTSTPRSVHRPSCRCRRTPPPAAPPAASRPCRRRGPDTFHRRPAAAESNRAIDRAHPLADPSSAARAGALGLRRPSRHRGTLARCRDLRS